MNVRGFLFSFICLWSCGCHLLALRRALGGQIPAQTLLGSSRSYSYLNRMMLLEPSQFLFPPGSSREASAPCLLSSPASFWEEKEGHHENIPQAKQAGRGQNPILLADPSPLETKLNCILQKQKQQNQVSIFQAASGCAHCCNAHAEQPLQQCLALWQPQTRPRILEQHQPEQRCSIFPRLLPFPGHKTKQNKGHPAEKDGGWIDDLSCFVFLHLNEKE